MLPFFELRVTIIKRGSKTIVCPNIGFRQNLKFQSSICVGICPREKKKGGGSPFHGNRLFARDSGVGPFRLRSEIGARGHEWRRRFLRGRSPTPRSNEERDLETLEP